MSPQQHPTRKLTDLLVELRSTTLSTDAIRRFLRTGGNPSTVLEAELGDETVKMPLMHGAVGSHHNDDREGALELLLNAGAHIDALGHLQGWHSEYSSDAGVTAALLQRSARHTASSWG
jgi:hypothetical protein